MLTLKSLLSIAGGGAATLALSVFWIAALVGANPTSAWLPPSGLSLQKQSDFSVAPASWNGNVDCYAENNSTCVINTLYGTANPGSSIRLANAPGYLPVVSNIDNHQHFIAIPNSDNYITYTTEPPYGLYLYFNNNFLSSIRLVSDGPHDYYQVTRSPDAKLADRDNHRLAADYASMGFSENGQWMVVSEPNVAMLRVNLQTYEVLPFAPGFDYSIGLSPSPQTAITNDGQYAVVASKDFSRFNIYDLNTCAAVPSTISGPVSCQTRDLQSFTSQQIPWYTNISNLRFIDDEALSLYAGYLDGSSHKTAKYILSDTNGVIHQQDYLALGDSYISGEGAFQYLQGTDTDDSQCHVSLVSYPYLLGLDLNYNAYHTVACSGATTNDIINTSDGYRGQAKPYMARQELDRSGALSNILSNFSQGYIDQLDFVKRYQPKVLTVSVGGNDIGFSDRLRSCLGIGTCYNTYEDRLEFVHEVNRALPRLVNTYTKLRTVGAADAQIYVIGYPQIAKADGNCAANVHMNHDELVFARLAIDYLDSVISVAAAKAGVFYVDTQDAFYGHRLCEAGPGSVAMNGISAGNDFPDKLGGPIGRESYHPNAFGHQLLEDKILIASNSLTNSALAPDLDARPPAETGLEILDAPYSDRAVNTTEFDPVISKDSTDRLMPLDISIDGAGHAIPPSSVWRAELHSTPVNLGNYAADANGDISAKVVIPADAPSGYHTLHFYGTDIDGRSIDIYKVIFITDNAVRMPTSIATADISGNLSSDSSNLIVSASGQKLTDNSSQTSPAVLGASITNPNLKNNLPVSDNLKIPGWYYLAAGGVFLFIVTLSYELKQRRL